MLIADAGKNKKVNTSISLIITLVIITSLIIITESNLNILNTFCLWILSYTYLFIFLNMVIFKNVIPKIIRMKNKILFTLISFILVGLLLMILPIRFQSIVNANRIEKLMMENGTITIEALGEKNDKSSGFDVAINKITVNYDKYDLTQIQHNQDWVNTNGYILSNSHHNTSIIIDFGKNNIINIYFKKNPSAGMIQVKINDFKYMYDLYSPEPVDEYQLDLKKLVYNPYANPYSIERILFYLIVCVILWLPISTFMIYISKYLTKKIN